MRTTIGKYDYLRNYDNIIDVFYHNGTTDSLIARFTKSGNVLISEINIDNPDSDELNNTAKQIFGGVIPL